MWGARVIKNLGIFVMVISNFAKKVCVGGGGWGAKFVNNLINYNVSCIIQ